MDGPITMDEAPGLLARAIETQGRDFVYNPGGCSGVCLYLPWISGDDDSPQKRTGCLIGVALGLAGVGQSVLSVAGPIDLLAAKFPGLMTSGVVDYFNKAQMVQDTGGTWGEAFDAAEEWRLAHAAR